MVLEKEKLIENEQSLMIVRQDTLPDIELMVARKQISASYKYDGKIFLSFIEKHDYSLMDPEGWIDYAGYIGNPINGIRYQARTYNRKISALKAVVRFVWQTTPGDDRPDRSVFELALKSLKRRKVQQKSVEPITMDQVKAMIEKAQEPIWGEGRNRPRPDLALFVEFLFKTGCRISEMVNILLTDIKPLDRERYKITLLGKGNKQREAYAKRELIDRILRHFHSKEYLFESRNHGHNGHDRRFRREHISVLINHCAKKVLGRGFGAHNLRHSFATHYYDRTHDLYGLQKLLGHSDVKITASTYVHGRIDPKLVTDTLDF